MSHPPKSYDLLSSLKTITCDDYFDAIEITHIQDEHVKELEAGIMDASKEKHVPIATRESDTVKAVHRAGG